MTTETIVSILGGAGLVMVVVAAVISRGRDGGADTRLAAIERRQKLIMDHLGIAEPQPETADIVAHLAEGRKIQAIKIYRERTGAGLKEAKDAVEEIARQRGIADR